MTYKKKFVAVIKCNGKIMEDDGGMVRIPFGYEYSIYMKNLNTRKAVINVSVDGSDTLGGNQIVLGGGQSMNLKGFMQGMSVRNRFRFIKKTKEIQDYRGDKIDDGIVRVEFTFEKRQTFEIGIPKVKGPWDCYYETGKPDWTFRDTGSSGGWNDSSATFSASFGNVHGLSSNKRSAPKSEEGITVPGSPTNQQFQYTNVAELEPRSEVIILRLVGKTTRGRKIRKPITTKTRITCPTCGRRWKSTNKYCGNCSTYIG